MYLVVEEAVEGEDEDTLQRVADGEEIHEDELSGVVADVDETQTPDINLVEFFCLVIFAWLCFVQAFLSSVRQEVF